MCKGSVTWVALGIGGGWPLAYTVYMAVRWHRIWVYTAWLAVPVVLALAVAWLLRGRREFRALVRDFLICSGLYCSLIVGGLLLVFAGCAFVGYLPYSDRPGPGWESPHVPSWEEMWFCAEWELMMVPGLVFWAAVFFALMEWLGWLRIHRWMERMIAGVLCGSVSLIMTAATGWYIALAPFPGNMAGIFGLLFGIFVLPRFTHEGKRELPLWLRIAGTVAPCLGLVGWIVWPFVRG